MSKTKNDTKSGLLSLNTIPFDRCILTTVRRHNTTAGRIYLPVSWVGKEVYVVQEKKE